MKYLAASLIALASCAAPDTYGVEVGHSEAEGGLDFDGKRRSGVSSDEGSDWLALVATWEVGAKARHAESMAQQARIERRLEHQGLVAPPVEVNVAGADKAPSGGPEPFPWDVVGYSLLGALGVGGSGMAVRSRLKQAEG